ncbi:MAG: hypothetical protein AAGI49_13820 [Bacteroidota bacterium]
MKIANSKLFLVLSRLSKKEIKALKQFVASPYFNQRTDVQLLLAAWEQHRKVPLDAQSLFQKIYPRRRYSVADLRLVMSYLFKLVDAFLVQQKMSAAANKATLERWKVSAYQDLKLPKMAQRLLQKERPVVYRDANYYYEQFQQLSLAYEFSSIEKPAGDHQFQAMSDYLDQAYLSMKLRQSCLALSHQAVYQSDFEAHFLAEVATEVEHRQWFDVPAIGIYYFIYKTLTAERQAAMTAFQSLKNLLFVHHESFPDKEIRDIYVMTINHCIRSINQGEKAYLKESLAIYKAGIEGTYLLENGIISRFTYGNVVRIALSLKDLDWVEQFIHQYKNALEKPFRASIFNFSLAALAYARKQYDEAAKQLQNFNYKDVLMNLSAKTLLLKIYYEWEAYDLLDAHLDAMHTYIQRKKVLAYHRTNYLNIVQYAKKLMQLNFYDQTAVADLQAQIAQEAILMERAWFLEQLFSK